MAWACKQVDITLICLVLWQKEMTHIKSPSGETALNMVQVFAFVCAFTDFVPYFSDDVFG